VLGFLSVLCAAWLPELSRGRLPAMGVLLLLGEAYLLLELSYVHLPVMCASFAVVALV
jgi:hypothetical protein